MIKNVLLLTAMCLPLVAGAQKAPKKAFSTENPPLAGTQWQAGGEINLFDGTHPQGVVYSVTDAGVRTSFAGNGARRSEEGNWLAVYPASALRQWENETLHFVIPHEQVAGKADMPLYNRTDGRDFVFKPLTAYLSFDLPAGLPPISEIRFCADKFLSGNYKANLGAKTVSVQLDTGDRYREIILKPENGGVFASGVYTMSLFARIFPDGLTAEFVSPEGKVAVVKIPIELKFALGKVRDLGVLHNIRFEEEKPIVGDYPKTDAGKKLADDFCAKIAKVVWDTTWTVTPGLEYYEMKVVTDTDEPQDLFLLRVDPSQGLDIKVAISNETTGKVWKRQTPAKMVEYLSTPEKPIYAAVNADFCDNREPIKPRGPVHCDGKIWAPSYSLDPAFPAQALSYLGVTHDGKMTIAPSSNYAAAQSTLKECTGGGAILLLDYQIQGGFVTQMSRHPRTAVGYTEDQIVWILATDARHGTSGMTYGELASIFKGLGCIDAVNLDGGGSTQMLVRDPATGEVNLRNWPSDPHNGFGGRERPRLNSWIVMKK